MDLPPTACGARGGGGGVVRDVLKQENFENRKVSLYSGNSGAFSGVNKGAISY